MITDFDKQQLIDKAVLKKLTKKSNNPAIFKLICHLGIFATCILILSNYKLPLYGLLPLLLFFGFVTFSLYAPFHETTHKTAFKSKFLNYIGAWFTGFTYGYSPGMHKAFHFKHHHLTNKKGDPEKGFSLPPMPGRIPIQILVAGVLGMLVPVHSLILSFAPIKKWDKFQAAWTSEKKRKTLAWECRVISLGWIGMFYLLTFNLSLMVYVLIALFLARFIHGFITVTEHEGLASEGHMLYRTRCKFSKSPWQKGAIIPLIEGGSHVFA